MSVATSSSTKRATNRGSSSSASGRVVVVALIAGLVALALARDLGAEGMRGSAKDRLDWPGSATDRYLDGDEVAAVLGAAAQQFSDCATLPELAAPQAQSPNWLHFGIDSLGSVAGAQVVNDASPEALRECLLAALQSVAFPDHDGALIRYSYPVVLVAEAGAVRNIAYPVVLFDQPAIVLPLLSLPPDLAAEDREAIAAELVPRSR